MLVHESADASMSYVRDRAVVLRTYSYGEANRIVVLATEEQGKLRTVAKGIAKTKSRFGARLEPTTHVEVVTWQGKGMPVVTQVDVVDNFRSLRTSLSKLTRAMSILEVVDQVLQEHHANKAVYRMLVGVLRVLDQEDSPMILPAFFWKLLAEEGYSPVIDHCVICSSKDNLAYYDVALSGVRCRSCGGSEAVSKDALMAIRLTLGGGLVKVLNMRDESLAEEMGRLATRSMEYHLERRLKSLRIAPS